MKQYQIAIVGYGGMGHWHNNGIRQTDRVAFCGVYDINPERMKLAQQEGIPTAYESFEAVLADEKVDAVLIATPNNFHKDLACRAMENGWHVCTEVPAAFTLAECERLVETVERTGRKYQLMEQARYWGFVEEYARMNRAGELGHVCLAQGEYVHYEPVWDNWLDLDTGETIRRNARPPGRRVAPSWRSRLWPDAILYLPHTLSPLLKILDDRVVSVSCMGTRPQSYAGELASRVDVLQKENRTLRKELEKAQSRSGGSGNIMEAAVEAGGVRLLAVKVGSMGMKALRELMDDVRSRLPSGVACLAAEDSGKAQIILYVSRDLHDRFTAPELIRAIAAPVGGSGGGRPDMAQAGGTNPAGIDEALALLKAKLEA